jgi:CheY-like chemotaxis protein
MKPVILCVDDERIVLDSLKIQLRSHFGNAYRYEVAENALDALEIVDEIVADGGNLVIIVSDWLMPGMRGDEFLIHIQHKYPQIVKIMLTGQADEDAVQLAFEKAHLHACIHKPWETAELIQAIETALLKL